MVKKTDLPFVPYKKENNRFARHNRFHPTPAEQKMRDDILKHRPIGYKFTRQKPIDSYIADFYCAKLLLVVEIDGEIHNDTKVYDEIRECKFAEYGIETLRFSNNMVMNDLEDVKKSINNYILERQNFLL